MGYHYANFGLMADPTIDPLRPEVLLYLPDANGNLELVGVEYLKFDADGSLLTDDDRPSFFGQPFNGPMPGHNPRMPVHYDLHVWVAEQNPSGVYAQWNPALRALMNARRLSRPRRCGIVRHMRVGREHEAKQIDGHGCARRSHGARALSVAAGGAATATPG